jgi:XTP/dITP diphosphohydrolase
MKILVATNNNHKIKELKKLINMPNREIFSMKDLNINLDIEENGSTFAENAHIKAKALYEHINNSEYIVIADDSGLCVDFLNGAPGIYSARFSGGDDADNRKKLLYELNNVPTEKRAAHFNCTIALINNGNSMIFEGICNGIITEKESGENGFGYDSLFFYPELNKTFAELSSEEKNLVSHRANAVKKLKEYLENL